VTNKEKLDLIEQKQSEIFDKIKQKENQSLDHKLEDSRKEITKFFLSWFFWLIFGAFIFCYIYNLTFAVFFPENKIIEPVDIGKIVPLITTTFGTGMGFIIGYYFKGNQ
jgi:hypothetical protein